MHLLDVNVLIAICDPLHVHHAVAVRHFRTLQPAGWATCPLTENGFVRIFGSPAYPQGPGSTDRAARFLRQLLLQPGHRFWPDSISLMDASQFPHLPVAKHLTDYYLLALAVEQGGRLATFDQRIDPGLIKGGSKALQKLSA